MAMSMTIKLGIDRLVETGFAELQGLKVGLFTNLSAVNRDLTPTYDLFRKTDKVQLVALFSPEHGLAGAVADGVIVASGIDTQTGLPIHSLYGGNYHPTAEMLNGIDLLVCDIQDIGVRYYTFLWTITHILEACGEYGVRVMLLDRPNPLGKRVDGGGLQPELASLVGRHPIPIQHGMTLGELASMINAIWNPTPADLSVMRYEGTSAGSSVFVPPSPNMAHLVTAQHYPGACLVEGTSLSEGRGTALPFELAGAPGIDGAALAVQLNALNLEGVRFRPHQFQPTASKHSNELCGGVQVHITDAASYRPIQTWLHVIRAMRPHFTWLESHFDRLIGDTSTREKIDAGVPIDDIIAEWDTFLADFDQKRQPYLLYERN